MNRFLKTGIASFLLAGLFADLAPAQCYRAGWGCYPPPPCVPHYPPQQPGYLPQQPGYPPQQLPGYPPQQPGYPPQQQPGYPPQQQPGYPPQQQPGYPPQQQPGYPPQQQPGYPPQQQPGYPPQQQPGYPPQQQPGYPPQQQPGYPPQQPGYPPQQPGVPKQALALTGTWQSNIGVAYTVNVQGGALSWSAPALKESATITLLGGNQLSGVYQGTAGSGTVTGQITQFDTAGRATRITWNNGVVFFRL